MLQVQYLYLIPVTFYNCPRVQLDLWPRRYAKHSSMVVWVDIPNAMRRVKSTHGLGLDTFVFLERRRS